MNKTVTAYLAIDRKNAKDADVKIEKKANFFPYQYYFDDKGNQHLKDDKRIGILFVPNSKCTNSCLFCGPNVPILEKMVDHKLILSKAPSVRGILADVKKLYAKNKDTTELCIGAGIGEPLLYFNTLLKLISELKKEIPVPIRLNTNGQATAILPEYSTKKISDLLQKSGLNSIMISLNSINEKDYNKLCNPKFQNAFKSTISFIKACNKSKINTIVSFVDYPASLGYPILNKKKIDVFRIKIGLNKDQIVYRPYFQNK